MGAEASGVRCIDMFVLCGNAPAGVASTYASRRSCAKSPLNTPPVTACFHDISHTGYDAQVQSTDTVSRHIATQPHICPLQDAHEFYLSALSALANALILPNAQGPSAAAINNASDDEAPRGQHHHQQQQPKQAPGASGMNGSRQHQQPGSASVMAGLAAGVSGPPGDSVMTGPGLMGEGPGCRRTSEAGDGAGLGAGPGAALFR